MSEIDSRNIQTCIKCNNQYLANSHEYPCPYCTATDEDIELIAKLKEELKETSLDAEKWRAWVRINDSMNKKRKIKQEMIMSANNLIHDGIYKNNADGKIYIYQHLNRNGAAVCKPTWDYNLGVELINPSKLERITDGKEYDNVMDLIQAGAWAKYIDDKVMEDLYETSERTNKKNRIVELATELMKILNTKEESDNGREFHPTTISSCRVMHTEKLSKILPELEKLCIGL